MTMLACNYAQTQSIMLLLMSVSFFGKGVGALGWTVISDTSPKGMVGTNGALFQLHWQHGGYHDADYYRIFGRENRLNQRRAGLRKLVRPLCHGELRPDGREN
jgi:hypothetical protein